MICYKDKTFCPFWKDCDDGDNCNDALTDDVIAKAKEWWGRGEPAPISQYVVRPACFSQAVGE